MNDAVGGFELAADVFAAMWAGLWLGFLKVHHLIFLVRHGTLVDDARQQLGVLRVVDGRSLGQERSFDSGINQFEHAVTVAQPHGQWMSKALSKCARAGPSRDILSRS